jgi:hypothetical protein
LCTDPRPIRGKTILSQFFLFPLAEYIAPFNGFSIPEIAPVAAIARTPAFNAAAAVESAAAVSAGSAIIAIDGLQALAAVSAGSRASLVLNQRWVR